MCFNHGLTDVEATGQRINAEKHENDISVCLPIVNALYWYPVTWHLGRNKWIEIRPAKFCWNENYQMEPFSIRKSVRLSATLIIHIINVNIEIVSEEIAQKTNAPNKKIESMWRR